MEKEGFTFVGWYTDPAFKTKVSTPDAYKVTKSCYLYAKWKEGEPSTLGKTTRGDMFNLANNVKVTWKEVPGATYYKVYREGITDKSETQKDPVIVTTPALRTAMRTDTGSWHLRPARATRAATASCPTPR